MKILLVDDENVAVNALKKRVAWGKYGFDEIFTALNTKQARRILSEHQIDLMLCDIEMPGENGLDFLEQIHDQYPNLTCIMVTFHADFNYLKRAMKYGIMDYILKPVDYEELEGLLEKYCKSKGVWYDQNELEKIIDKAGGPVPANTSSNEGRIQKVKDYISEHLQEKIHIEDLANLVYLDEQYLMKLFKKSTGKTLIEYITEQKMIMAGNLLRETDYSINFISDCIGCENYSYFSKIFKKYYGLSPREYRSRF